MHQQGGTIREALVRDLIRERDGYRRLGLPQTAVAAAALGELGKGTFAELTAHDTALGEPDIESYTLFVCARQIATLDIRRGDLVRCGLRGVGVPDRGPVWLCDHIEFAM